MKKITMQRLMGAMALVAVVVTPMAFVQAATTNAVNVPKTVNAANKVNAALNTDRTISHSGTISSVGMNTNSFTFSTDRGKTITVDLTATTTIMVNGTSSNASALTSGMKGSVSGMWTDATNTVLTANTVNVRDMSRWGAISNMNASSSSFTLANGKGKSTSVNLSSSTQIFVDGVATTTFQLANGMKVSVLGAWTDGTKTALNAMTVNVRTGKGKKAQ